MGLGEVAAIATTSPLLLPAGSGKANLLFLFERPLEERGRVLSFLAAATLCRRGLVREELGPAEQVSLLRRVARVMLARDDRDCGLCVDRCADRQRERFRRRFDRSPGVVDQQRFSVGSDLLRLGEDVHDLSGW